MSDSFLGIVKLPVVAVRLSMAEQSELVTQLLYGETVEILNVEEKWLYIKSLHDGYLGWVDKKMIEPHEPQAFVGTKYMVKVPLVECENIGTGGKIYLPGGSIISPNNKKCFDIAGELYKCSVKNNDEIRNLTLSEQIVLLSDMYKNAPYLWGGKTILGIDCAALVQVVFAMVGIQLPRDAGDQSEYGIVVPEILQSKPADLAFFANADGKIVHVGILIGKQKIIHASAFVKVENIDNEGIISSVSGMYSHKLILLKRILKE